MNEIKIRQCGAHKHNGVLHFGPHHTRCALGAGGIRVDKQEGDGATPAGRYPLRRIWYRPDRLMRPESAFPMVEIAQKSGWCDDIHAPAYNRPIWLPHRARHERLWRQDRLYDVFFEIGYNDAPVERGRGSAIFLHLEKNNFNPTRGCIAVNHASMAFLLRHTAPGCHITIAAP